MLNSVLYHIIPTDGKFFDDTEQTVASLIFLQGIIIGLFLLAVLAMQKQKKDAATTRRLARHQAKLAREEVEEEVEELDEPSPSAQTRSQYRRPPKKRH